MVKSVAVRTLTPAARLSERFMEPLRRAWAHARLAAGTSQPVDSSVVFWEFPRSTAPRAFVLATIFSSIGSYTWKPRRMGNQPW
jgi:hypothetical protein